MKISTCTLALALGLTTFSPVFAQSGTATGLQQPASVARTSYEYGSYYYDEQQEEEASAPVAADSGYAPSGCNTCGPTCAPACTSCAPRSCGSIFPCDPCSEAWSLFDSCWLEERGIALYGWVDQGFTWNPQSPANRFNGPVTFNDRANEYQMNQLYLIAERATDTGGYGFDVGGRIDLLYGTDWRYDWAYGLEYNVDGTQNWNRSSRFYGLAMPQLYAEFAVNDLTIKMGRFYTIIGYEVVTAPDNFFYSHAYTMQYGEPFTHTGILATWAASDNWSISAGLHRGWDQWEDYNSSLGFLGGITWTSDTEDTSLAYALTTSNEADHVNGQPGNANRFMNSIVFTQNITSRLSYVLQHDLGYQDGINGDPDGEWYGINQYAFYRLTDCWSAGARVEWFRDDDGIRVYSPSTDSDGFAGNFYEVTLGLNYKPNANLVVRPEVRWDWYDGVDPNGQGPYDDGNKNHQFLFATDVIITF